MRKGGAKSDGAQIAFAKSDKEGAWDVTMKRGDDVKKLVLSKSNKKECVDTCKTKGGEYPKLKRWMKARAVGKCMKEKNSCECIQKKITKRRPECEGCFDCEV